MTTTRTRLSQLAAGLVVCTVVVLVASLSVLQGAHAKIHTIRTRTAPAILGVAAARAALVAADSAAIGSLRPDMVRLAGPGEQYQNQIATATQSLEQVAEANVAGAQGSRTLRLVNGLLAAYTSLIEQADAHYRQPGAGRLGAVNLWDASHLMHARDGILGQLDDLSNAQQRVLYEQRSSTWIKPAATVAWAVPAAVLLLLLCVTQVYLSRRFRRTVNLPLLAATTLAIALCVLTSLTVRSEHRVGAARHALDDLRLASNTRTDAVDVGGQGVLATRMRSACAHSQGACADTVNRFTRDLDSRRPAAPVATLDDRQLADATAGVNGQIAAADRTLEFPLVIPVVTASIVAMILAGLRPRLDEYRYRSR
jgi:hypothetical protein